MLYLVRGLPGSGKSTYARALGCLVVEADLWNQRGGRYDYDHSRMDAAHAWCLARAREAVDSGFDIAVANIFAQCKFMAPYVEYARAKRCPVWIVECRGTNRTHLSMPWKAIQQLRKAWEPVPWEWAKEMRVVAAGDENGGGRTGSQVASQG